jgi:hypothetical protein
MNRYAIFVDAGYFFAAGAKAAAFYNIPRKQIALKDPARMVEYLTNHISRTISTTGATFFDS